MKILKSNDALTLIPENVEIIAQIKHGLYDLNQDVMTREFSLMERPYTLFKVPGKIYGDNTDIITRIQKSYETKDSNLGILFIGEKGTGKTLIAKKICNRMDLPVIIINSYYRPNELIKFLTGLPCQAIVFIDEFEKVYDVSTQNELLTLLDGTSDNNLLFLFTGNNVHRINDHFRNRTSRIKYLIEFESLDIVAIKEMIEDMLKDKETHELNIIKLFNIMGNINYDVLQTIIEEVNMFDDSEVNNLLRILNISPESSLFNVTVTNKKDHRMEFISHDNPLVNGIAVEGYWMKLNKDKQGIFNYKLTKDWEDTFIKTHEIKDLIVTNLGYTFSTEEFKIKCIKKDIKKLVF